MTVIAQAVEVAVERLGVSAYAIPTDHPESDGTARWDSTTLVAVEAFGGGEVGLGYTYGNAATATLARDTFAPLVEGSDAMRVSANWRTLCEASRNLGRPGIASMAIAGIDTALWDLKARLLGLPLASLLDAEHDSVPIYGSGGFTSYPDELLTDQLARWVNDGIPRVKMKIGREPERDRERVAAAREAIGDRAELFVDANGALSRKQALRFAGEFAADFDVRWFEEPVSSDDLAGLRLIRDHAPLEIAAGEYGYTLDYFGRMLDAGAVDCLQADVTRCEGITGFLRVAALCETASIDLSAHCAPSLHVHPCCAVGRLRHLEYFHDHVRVEQMVFDGVLEPVDGELRPDLSRPGNGLELKRADAERYAI